MSRSIQYRRLRITFINFQALRQRTGTKQTPQLAPAAATAQAHDSADLPAAIAAAHAERDDALAAAAAAHADAERAQRREQVKVSRVRQASAHVAVGDGCGLRGTPHKATRQTVYHAA
jgi:hypothetical protein